jgi:hypothetical protein
MSERVVVYTNGIADLARGAVGVAKAALGRDRAPEDAITARWDSCLACEKHDRRGCCGKRGA